MSGFTAGEQARTGKLIAILKLELNVNYASASSARRAI